MKRTRIILILILILVFLLIPTRKVKSQPPVVETKQVRVIAAPAIPIESPQYQYFLLIEEHFQDNPIMIKIAQAESGFDCKIKNPASSASGCFQIIKGTWKDYGCLGDVFNALDNIMCAKKIFTVSGTTPWNESRHNWAK